MSSKKFVKSVVGPLFVLVMFVAAIWLLHNELRHYQLHEFIDSLSAIPAGKLALALGMTALNYIILIGYELLGVKYIGHPMSLGRVALGSFLGSVVANNFGNLFGGSSVRYRLYSAWGYSAFEIVQLMLILQVTFWIGLFALSGLVFVVEPLRVPDALNFPGATTRPLGIVLCCLAASYLLICALRRSPLRIWKWEFSPPPLTLSLLQYVVASLDLMVAAGVLYVLLPESLQTNYFHFLAIYLLGLVAVFVTQVPGGLGVIELVMLLLLRPSDPHVLIGALLAFRLIYFLLPLVVGLLIMGAHEFHLQRQQIKRAVGVLSEWGEAVVPRVMALSVFSAGIILLLSVATPDADSRHQLINRVLPLPVIEVAHLLTAIVGAMLVISARTLQRRTLNSYWRTVALLAAGSVLSLLKGLNYEEAGVLALMLVVLLPCKRDFYRKRTTLGERFSLGWSVATALAIACAAGLMLFAFKHVDYANELWWRFGLHDDMSRSLRALTGVVLMMIVLAVAQRRRTQEAPPSVASGEAFEAVRAIVASSPRASARLALLGDKQFLLNQSRTAFVMYSIEGRSWVSLSDPAGDDDDSIELAWDFFELCERNDNWPVFYHVDEERLPIYVDMGLTLIKLGEESRVPLLRFDLESKSQRDFRESYERILAEGCSLEIIPPQDVKPLLPTLMRISDAWLAERNTNEKSFSLGYFQPAYLQAIPMALVRHNSKIIAFANLLHGADNDEISVDLLRYVPDSPDEVMDFMFVELMLIGKREGYRWFNLGLAPSAHDDFATQTALARRIASLGYPHGDHFGDIQQLRQWKERFGPQWRAKYLASPGGFLLRDVINDVASLIAGHERSPS